MCINHDKLDEIDYLDELNDYEKDLLRRSCIELNYATLLELRQEKDIRHNCRWHRICNLVMKRKRKENKTKHEDECDNSNFKDIKKNLR